MTYWFFSMSPILVAFVAFVVIRTTRQPALKPHLLRHNMSYVPDMLSEEQAAGLRALARDDLRQFDNIAKDLNFYKSENEHIGEARPIGADGKCDHPFLVPSQNGTLCVLPGRVDVARHYLKTGGVQALKERYETATSRLQAFAAYIFDVDKWPIIKELFSDETFLDHARSVCPPDKQYLDPFQMNFIMQVPGQTVATHTDAPYFLGATRFHYPQWLLVAMVHSGLFQEYFIDQVQVVGYFHEWQATEERGGAFVFWRYTARAPEFVMPVPRAGTIVDGSKVIHAASVYNGPGGVHAPKPPVIDKSRVCALHHDGDDQWHVECDGEVLRRYTTDDLRMAIVYRGKCFVDAAAAERFNADRPEDRLSLDFILQKFKIDLWQKRVIHIENEDAPVEPLELAMHIIDTYIRYPHSPSAYVPLNYCSLAKLYPWTSVVLDLIC